VHVHPITWAYIGAAALGIAVLYEIKTYGSDVKTAAGDALQAVNPVNPDNVFASAANKVVQAATGEPDATLGAKIWEWLHPGAVAAEQSITDPLKVTAPLPAAGKGDAVDLGAFNEGPLGALYGTPWSAEPSFDITIGRGASGSW
jgi:hypothetical protein